MSTQPEQLRSYPVWDRTVRIFHWVNVLAILGLIAVGTVILNDKALGVTNDGKILLKTVHVYIGYVFVLNLAWRLLWGFVGGRYARWKTILPFIGQYWKQHQAFFSGLKEGKTVGFMGHSPPGRWTVTLLFLLMVTMSVTGLVVGGTDVYMPPFGNNFKTWVAESPEAVALIKPYSKEGVNEEAYQAMRDFRKPFIKTHYYGFFVLLAVLALHLLGVIVMELREGSGLISAMFTGKKVFSEKPADLYD